MNKKERPLLERYVPGLVQRAWQTYVAKYHFTPQTPLTGDLRVTPYGRHRDHRPLAA